MLPTERTTKNTRRKRTYVRQIYSSSLVSEEAEVGPHRQRKPEDGRGVENKQSFVFGLYIYRSIYDRGNFGGC